MKLLSTVRPDLMYLSTSDYVQHKHAPGEPEADAYHHAVDTSVATLIALGATVAITADHGMNDKSAADGTPNVIYLEDELNSRFGAGSVRVICPIADPFVRHHGALGSFVRVHLRKAGDVPAMMALCPHVARRRAGARQAAGVQAIRSSDRPRRGFRGVQRPPTRSSARGARITISVNSRGTGCARMAASASRRCRSCCRGRSMRSIRSGRKPDRCTTTIFSILR